MRILGIILSFLLGVFFGVGSQTFTSSGEHIFAVFMFWYCLALLVVTVLSFFSTELRRVSNIMTVGAILVTTFLWGLAEGIIPHA